MLVPLWIPVSRGNRILSHQYQLTRTLSCKPPRKAQFRKLVPGSLDSCGWLIPALLLWSFLLLLIAVKPLRFYVGLWLPAVCLSQSSFHCDSQVFWLWMSQRDLTTAAPRVFPRLCRWSWLAFTTKRQPPTITPHHRPPATQTQGSWCIYRQHATLQWQTGEEALWGCMGNCPHSDLPGRMLCHCRWLWSEEATLGCFWQETPFSV